MKRSEYIGKLFQFDRGECNAECNGEVYTNGYVLDLTDDWTLIQYVERDIFFNGYQVFRNDTVEEYRELTDRNRMVHRALRQLEYVPKLPKGIDLTDLNSIILSVNRVTPLVVVHRELWKKDVCHIGGIAGMTSRTVTLSLIDPDAKYGGTLRINSKDITKISFDGHYEIALWAVATKSTKSRITSGFKSTSPTRGD